MSGTGTLDDLIGMFTTAVNAFNQASKAGTADLSAFARYLSANATVYSNSERVGYTPKAVALAYLVTQMGDKPNFQLPASFNQGAAGAPTILLNKAGTSATMSGTTTWTDENHPNGEQLMFSFTFVWSASYGWRFLTLWAADET
jgi:hypothetical protein